jgi:hypothetical protein
LKVGPQTRLSLEKPDVSSLIDYNFYEPIWYYDEISQFHEPKRYIGRWLGQAYNVGQAMCYWVLPSNSIPMARSTVTPIKPEEQMLDSVQQELAQHNKAIIDKLGGTTADSGEEENPLDKDDEDDHITHTFEPI